MKEELTYLQKEELDSKVLDCLQKAYGKGNGIPFPKLVKALFGIKTNHRAYRRRLQQIKESLRRIRQEPYSELVFVTNNGKVYRVDSPQECDEIISRYRRLKISANRRIKQLMEKKEVFLELDR